MSNTADHAPHLPPPLVMLHKIFGTFISQAICVAAKYSIADQLADGPRSATELASKAGLHGPALERILRLLASVGIFSQQPDGRFELTPLAATLQADHPQSMRPMALLMGWPKYWAAVGDLSYAVETNKAAFEHLWGTTLYEHCANNPEDLRTFNDAMTGFAVPSAMAVRDAYDFSGISQLVDVGGGHGTYMITFLKANPELRGILFDQPHVVAGARQALESAGLAERCEVVAGNFFEEVPAGGDAYILEDIIHNWDDDHATKILKNIHRAMAKDARLLLVEMVIPPGNEPFFGKQLDVIMLVLLEGGRERTEPQFRELLGACGFELTRIMPTHSLMSVVEARRV